MSKDNYNKIVEFVSGELGRAARHVVRLDEGRIVDEGAAWPDDWIELSHAYGAATSSLLNRWSGPAGLTAHELTHEILNLAEARARQIGGIEHFWLRAHRRDGGLSRLSFFVDGTARTGRLEVVSVPIDSLLGPRVLDWTMALFAQPEVKSEALPQWTRSEARVEVDQEVLVRLDGVVYLLRGNPLEAMRRAEGPVFHPWRPPAPEGSSPSPYWADGDGDDGDDKEIRIPSDDDCIPMWPVDSPDDPIVVTLVRRPARPEGAALRSASQGPGRVLVDSLVASLGPHPTDRMDEASDRLCAIDERSGLIVLEVGAQWYLRLVHAPAASRQVLPMSSGTNVLPNTTVQVTSRPQNGAFRPERIILGGTPSDWVINDVRIGNRSQFAQSGDIPGEMFAASSIDTFVSLEIVQATMDITIFATFVGASESGSPFVAAIVGTIADPGGERMERRPARRSAMRWTPEGRLQGWMVGLTGEDENRDLDPGHRTATAPVDAKSPTESPFMPRPPPQPLGAYAQELRPPLASGPDPGAPSSHYDDDDSTEASAMITSGS